MYPTLAWSYRSERAYLKFIRQISWAWFHGGWKDKKDTLFKQSTVLSALGAPVFDTNINDKTATISVNTFIPIAWLTAESARTFDCNNRVFERGQDAL